MDRTRGLSIRLKLALSYVGFLLLAGVLLLVAAWLFLLGRGFSVFIPDLKDFFRVFDPGNFGPRVFIPATILVLGFLLVFGIIGGWILAGRMLAPVHRITAATRKAATGSLSHRIELAGRRDEFRELADSFNAMLARLEAHDAEQRRFVANASHELRTPLAITHTLLDIASNDPNRDGGDIDVRLRAVNTRAIELTEALLLLNRADQRSFAREPVDRSLIAEEATETILPLADKHRVAVEISCAAVWVNGSYTLLLQLTTNLLHNAIVHNLPKNGTVKVTAAVERESASLTVENTGQKLSPEWVTTLTEPFRRGAERTCGDHAGCGLGLTIVKSIVQAHDGTLSLSPRVEGGLSVIARLPAGQ